MIPVIYLIREIYLGVAISFLKWSIFDKKEKTICCLKNNIDLMLFIFLLTGVNRQKKSYISWNKKFSMIKSI